MLLTKRIESVIDPIKKLYQFSPSILLNDLIETFNVYKDHSDFPLRLWKVLLAVLDPRPNQTWNQDVDNRFQLLQLLNVPKLGHKAHFLLNLVPIRVIRPKEDIQGHCQRLPYQLNRAIFVICDISYGRQTNVKESDCGCKADQRNEKDRIQSDKMWESDCVEELDLN